MLRLALVLLSVAGFAAEGAKPQEVTLTSTLRGRSSHLVLELPASFNWTLSKGVAQGIKAYSADQRVCLQISLLPPGGNPPRTAEDLEARLRESGENFAPDSVEGKVITHPFKMTNGIAFAATYTDKSEVGKPVPKGPEHYKLLTSVFVRVGESVAVCTLLSDSKDQPDHVAALKVIETLREGK
ncbi:MAG: hypothetical protein ACO23N_06445 [Opitutales bacterium]